MLNSTPDAAMSKHVVSIAQRKREGGPDERRDREQGSRTSRAEATLRAEIQSQADPVADSATTKESDRVLRRGPRLVERQGDCQRETGADQRLAEDDGARVEVGERTRQRVVERPAEGRGDDGHQPERARAAAGACA